MLKLATPSHPQPKPGHRLLPLLLFPALLVLPVLAPAQAPGWAGATTGSLTQVNGTSITQAVATDARGNVFVTGSFSGSVAFGNTLLTSVGSNDLFVAKYVPSTGTWAWAQSGGGIGYDIGNGIAVSGINVYVTGSIQNNTSNDNRVLFGGTGTTAGTVPVNGASGTTSSDLLLAKYTDNGSTATLGWTQIGGGTSSDVGNGVAASGTTVYVTGYFTNSTSNDNRVLFGGTGTTAGTVPVNGATSNATNSDLLLAKYTDQGSTATLAWTQVGGGTRGDSGTDVAVSGANVYVTGFIVNSTSNAQGVLFGGNGTTVGTVPVSGASSNSDLDLVLAKYTDNGSTAALTWTQVGGGTSYDGGNGIAVSGANVYVTGFLTNNTSNTNRVLFGGTGTVAGTVPVNGASSAANPDLLLAKYTDQGSSATLGWTQVGGGTNGDSGNGVAVSGSSVYVTGSLENSTTNAQRVLFGGNGTTVGTVPVNGASGTTSSDLLLAKYTDNGSTATLAWAQVGGGTSYDAGYGVALSGQSVVAVGYVIPSASFGPITLATPLGAATSVLARATDASLQPLPVRNMTLAGGAALTLHPNPAHGRATVSGLVPSTAVQVLDALGRPVLAARADEAGRATLALPATLAPGLYLVRGGTQTARLVVE